MRITSQTNACIACGSSDVHLSPVFFQRQMAEFPICGACAPFAEPTFSDPGFGAAYMRFVGVAEMQHTHQQGGAFSFASAQDSVPRDLAARLSDFDLYCQFLGSRILALRQSAGA